MAVLRNFQFLWHIADVRCGTVNTSINSRRHGHNIPEGMNILKLISRFKQLPYIHK